MSYDAPAPACSPIRLRFEIRALLSSDGLTRIYSGRERTTGRSVRITEWRAPATLPSEVLFGGIVDRLRAVSRVDHPHLIKPSEIAQEGELLLVVTAAPEGETLRKRFATWPAERVRDDATAWIATVAGALDALHRAQLVHGSLSPDTVLFDAAGAAYLGGLEAPSLDDVLPHALFQALDDDTERYRAPERSLSPGATPRSDLFSLGALAFEALAGRPLVAHAAVSGGVPRYSQRFEYIPRVVPFRYVLPARAVMRAVSVDAGLRPQSCGEFAGIYAAEAARIPAWGAIGDALGKFESYVDARRAFSILHAMTSATVFGLLTMDRPRTRGAIRGTLTLCIVAAMIGLASQSPTVRQVYAKLVLRGDVISYEQYHAVDTSGSPRASVDDVMNALGNPAWIDDIDGSRVAIWYHATEVSDEIGMASFRFDKDERLQTKSLVSQ